MFKPLWHTPVKATLATLLIVLGYAWVSADDWELELEEEQAKIELAQRLAPPDIPEELEIEPDWANIQPEPAPKAVLARAQKSVKKAAVKTKKRVKKSLKTRQWP